MKHTLKKLSAGFAAMLLAAFCIFALSQDAFAKPDWMQVKYSYPTLVFAKNKKNNQLGYLILKFTTTYINNNKEGKIVTAIFDKNMRVTYDYCPYANKSASSCYKGSAGWKSSKVNKVEIYPGQKWTSTWTIPLDRMPGNLTNVGMLNNTIISFNKKKQLREVLRNVRYHFNFQVRTK